MKLNIRPFNFLLTSFFAIAIFFSTASATAAESSPVYRFWSDLHQSHFFTISLTEKDYVAANYPANIWKYEGVAFYANQEPEEGLIPVYRFWSDQKQSHFYTASAVEKNHVVESYDDFIWKYEGIAYYVYPSVQEGTTGVFRFWSDQGQSHFYTATPNEKNCVTNRYPESVWKYEGESWWVTNTGIDLSNDPNICLQVGPEIKVGVWSYSRNDLTSGIGFSRIGANMNFLVKNSNGTVVIEVPAGTTVKVNYTTAGNLALSSDILTESVNVGNEVYFESASGNISDIIFETNIPKSYVKFRGKMSLRYSETTNNQDLFGDSKRIWLINTIPMEQYVWGMGEITGTGAMEYNKVMTTSFRTYGYFWLYEATKYIPEGFTVNATPGNQLYYGYDYEVKYPRIKEAAKSTRGHILTHPQSSFRDNVAITPYSSWTDGKTRCFPRIWGNHDSGCSTVYVWNKSVNDSYGKHPTLSTSELFSSGNHMVGLSANGALRLATDHGWNYQQIMQYYYTGVSFWNAY